MPADSDVFKNATVGKTGCYSAPPRISIKRSSISK